MRVGFLKDSPVLGASIGNVNPGEYIDPRGKKHHLQTICDLKGAFGHQGVMVDQEDVVNMRLWETLAWKVKPGMGFEMGNSPILFDVDLDHFTFGYRSKVYPWTRNIYNTEFPSLGEERVRGMSAKVFIQKLINRSPFVTIAMEPRCCGGNKASKNILGNFNKYFLNKSIDDLEFTSILE
jgi:hypothetical protein